MIPFQDWLNRKPKGPAPKRPLPKCSPKHKKEMSKYSIRCAVFKKKFPTCQICLRRPTKDVHHKAGRGKWLLVEEHWLPVCRPCHDHIEQNPKESRAMGLILDLR